MINKKRNRLLQNQLIKENPNQRIRLQCILYQEEFIDFQELPSKIRAKRFLNLRLKNKIKSKINYNKTKMSNLT